MTKIFNPNASRLDCKTVNCHFVGYPEKSKVFISTILMDILSLKK
jgi:hypothetical protein